MTYDFVLETIVENISSAIGFLHVKVDTRIKPCPNNETSHHLYISFSIIEQSDTYQYSLNSSGIVFQTTALSVLPPVVLSTCSLPLGDCLMLFKLHHIYQIVTGKNSWFTKYQIWLTSIPYAS